jgi:carbon storage regulator
MKNGHGRLVLSRKAGETIVIGSDGDITIKVMETHGNKIKLAIESPREMPIHRGEVYDAIQRGEIQDKGPQSLQPDCGNL